MENIKIFGILFTMLLLSILVGYIELTYDSPIAYHISSIFPCTDIPTDHTRSYEPPCYIGYTAVPVLFTFPFSILAIVVHGIFVLAPKLGLVKKVEK